jgi:hypothetical protein
MNCRRNAGPLLLAIVVGSTPASAQIFAATRHRIHAGPAASWSRSGMAGEAARRPLRRWSTLFLAPTRRSSMENENEGYRSQMDHVSRPFGRG